MMIGFLILGFSALLGAAVLIHFKLSDSREHALLGGLVFGISTFVTISYGISILGGGYHLRVTLLLLAEAAGLLFFFYRRRTYKEFRKLPSFLPNKLLLVMGVLICAITAGKLFYLDEGHLKTGVINAYGDVAWHSANVTAFAAGQTFPPDNPIFGGATLVYPFLVNYLSSLLLESGMSLANAITYPAVLFVPVMFLLFYLLVWEVTRNRLAAHLATWLFFFLGSTLGFTRFPRDFQDSKMGLWEFVTHLPNDDFAGAGANAEGYNFLNPIGALLLPQRNFLIGMPLVFCIALSLLKQNRNRRDFVFAGVLAGLLPMIHVHSGIVVAALLLVLFIYDRSRDWLYFLVASLPLGLLELSYFMRFNATKSHLGVLWGWKSGEFNGFFPFWFQNTGLFIPFLLFALYWKGNRMAKALGWTGLLLFAIGNSLRLARWDWDNFKVLVFVFIFGVPVVSAILADLLKATKSQWRTGIATFFLLFQSLTGMLDVWKTVLPTSARWVVFDKETLRAATEIAKVTPARARIASYPSFNSPVFLTGRSAYLGYPAHVWSHGGEPGPRELASKQFLEGEISELPQMHPDFVLIGPAEREHYKVMLRAEWKRVADTGTFQLYQLP